MPAASEMAYAVAEVRRGKLYIHNRRDFDAQISALREGWQLEISVKRLRATRSQQFNKFYWSVVVHMISEHTGYTPEEVHDLLKMRFIPKRLAVCNGNGVIQDEFVLGGSTREMDTEEFGAYVEEICQWAAESLDLIIPDADQGRL